MVQLKNQILLQSELWLLEIEENVFIPTERFAHFVT